MVDKLKNSKEDLILAALLSCPTIREAAAKCGVPERTITDYLTKPEFMERYKAEKAEIVKGVSTKIQGKMSKAVDVIGEIMEDTETPPAVRLNASKAIIEQGLKFQESDQIIERIEALEDKIEKSKK